jgi:hypothetical protein
MYILVCMCVKRYLQHILHLAEQSINYQIKLCSEECYKSDHEVCIQWSNFVWLSLDSTTRRSELHRFGEVYRAGIEEIHPHFSLNPDHYTLNPKPCTPEVVSRAVISRLIGLITRYMFFIVYEWFLDLFIHTCRSSGSSKLEEIIIFLLTAAYISDSSQLL